MSELTIPNGIHITEDGLDLDVNFDAENQTVTFLGEDGQEHTSKILCYLDFVLDIAVGALYHEDGTPKDPESAVTPDIIVTFVMSKLHDLQHQSSVDAAMEAISEMFEGTGVVIGEPIVIGPGGEGLDELRDILGGTKNDETKH